MSLEEELIKDKNICIHEYVHFVTFYPQKRQCVLCKKIEEIVDDRK